MGCLWVPPLPRPLSRKGRGVTRDWWPCHPESKQIVSGQGYHGVLLSGGASILLDLIFQDLKVTRDAVIQDHSTATGTRHPSPLAGEGPGERGNQSTQSQADAPLTYHAQHLAVVDIGGDRGNQQGLTVRGSARARTITVLLQLRRLSAPRYGSATPTQHLQWPGDIRR